MNDVMRVVFTSGVSERNSRDVISSDYRLGNYTKIRGHTLFHIGNEVDTVGSSLGFIKSDNNLVNGPARSSGCQWEMLV